MSKEKSTSSGLKRGVLRWSIEFQGDYWPFRPTTVADAIAGGDSCPAVPDWAAGVGFAHHRLWLFNELLPSQQDRRTRFSGPEPQVYLPLLPARLGLRSTFHAACCEEAPSLLSDLPVWQIGCLRRSGTSLRCRASAADPVTRTLSRDELQGGW